MNDVYILSGIRTPIGSFQGALSSFSSPKLGAFAIKAAIQKVGIDGALVDEVLMGCVLTGGLGQAAARQASLGGGIPNSVPCTTINKVCGSGMKSVMIGAQAIKLGDAEIIVAGGMESMTNAPYALAQARQGYRMGNGTLIDTMIQDGLWDPYNNCHMGSCGDQTAIHYQFIREEIDHYASESYQKTIRAQRAGIFDKEIIPIEVPQRKGDPILFSKDEEPSKGDIGKFSSLKPAFSKEGTVTPANASSISDGGAAIVLASKNKAEELSLKPLGRMISYATHAQEPEWFTTAPAYAIQKLLKKTGLSMSDIDLFEINEAFAVVPMVVMKLAGIPEEKVNVNGGAVALGHPIGMTGTRLIITALHELRRRGKRYAIATPCIGGGESTAVLIEAFS